MRNALARLFFDIPRSPENEGGTPVDDLTLDDPDVTDPQDDDAVDDAADTGDAAQPDQATQPEKQGGASDTIRSLRARAQEADRRADEASRRADDVDRRLREFENRRQPVDPAEEARRLELMTPDEKAEYKVNQALGRFQQAQAVRDFQTTERGDQQSFQMLRRADRIADRYADEVERELTKIRSEGGNVPREAVLNYVVGRALREKQASTSDKRSSDAQNRVRRQTTRPGNSRGDIGGNRRGNPTLESRLENVPI